MLAVDILVNDICPYVVLHGSCVNVCLAVEEFLFAKCTMIGNRLVNHVALLEYHYLVDIVLQFLCHITNNGNNANNDNIRNTGDYDDGTVSLCRVFFSSKYIFI